MMENDRSDTGVMKYSAKKDIIRNLYWDYNIDTKHYMKMLKNPKKANQDEYRKFFVRAFENTRWHEFIQLFDIATVLKLDTEDTKRLMKGEARKRFDTACAILRGEPVTISQEEVEKRKQALEPLLSDRTKMFKAIEQL